ncbi:MAG: PKD domain-containing protein [Bacteroidetes bacterium]|nr:PKD domain-containing protein [Bacteroidota bacterium]
MRVIFRALFLIMILLSSSQSGYAQLSTTGKEFWVGFMENNRGLNSPDYAVLVITATENTTGVIEFLGQSETFSLTAGQQYIFRKLSYEVDLLHRTSGVIENLGIHITASGKIAVHAFNERNKSADGTVVLPLGALGKDHYITSHFEVNPSANLNTNNESTLLVVATEDNTRIEITTTQNSISGQEIGVPSEIVLNRGQSYQIKARGDLTGSRVRVVGANADECKKISVFGGNKWISVGACGSANDHLYQQAYPVNTWGTSFVHTALLGRSSGELVKVLASEDNTEVRVNGLLQPKVLNRGEWLPLEFGANESGKIDTSKPSSVTVFSKSQACNNPSDPFATNGDPFMITYSPTEQLLTQLDFNAISLPSIVNHYVNIVVKAGEENQTKLDGVAIGNSFQMLLGDPTYKFAQIEISQGVHKLSNPAGFAAYVYGFGNIESYGYAAGAALNNLNFETEQDYAFDVEGDNVACLNQEGSWTVNPENPDFTYFVWNFGDGTPTKIGKNVTHTFKTPGKYEVIIIASLSPNSCDEQEEATFEVEVLETKADLIGSQSVCPLVEEVMYRVKNKQNIGQMTFEVEGGTILQSYSDSVLVRWGPSNLNAKVRALPFSANGCPGAAVELPVVVELRIVVTEALGEKEVCYDPSVNFTYSAPDPSSGRRYEWIVTGGTLVSGQDSAKIVVVWDQEDVTGTIGYTAYSLVDNSCAGTAPDIQVRVAKQLTLATQSINDVACFGEATGKIEVLAAGGTTNTTTGYTFEWSHDASLKTATASNLKAGLYSVKVTDALGCIQSIADIEVKEPPLLQLSNVTATPTTCFGKRDGQVRLEVIGGVAPYSLEFGGKQVFNGIFELDTLKKEIYNWEVTDSNGCKIPVSFEITSPPPLVVDVTLAKTACPGEANGELLVVPSGPEGPFQFLWTPSAQTTDLALGLAKGTYIVQVTDAAGCVSFGTGIVVEEAPKIRMPNAFNPTEAPGKFTGVSNCVVNFSMIIYNRWGQLVHIGNEGWDGTFEGDIAPTGTYSYATTYSYLMEGNTVQVTFRGSVLLVR